MSVTFQSVRFGAVEVSEDAVIEFPRGLIGLGGRRYALLDRNPGTGFLWLHSVEDPALGLPVVSPDRFFAGFELVLSAEDAESTGLPEPLRCGRLRDRSRHVQPPRHHRQPPGPAGDRGGEGLSGHQRRRGCSSAGAVVRTRSGAGHRRPARRTSAGRRVGQAAGAQTTKPARIRRTPQGDRRRAAARDHACRRRTSSGTRPAGAAFLRPPPACFIIKRDADTDASSRRARRHRR